MEKHKRTIGLVCAALFIASFVVRYAVNSFIRTHKPPPPPPPVQRQYVPPDPISSLPRFLLGRGYLAGRGLCNLRLELQDDYNHYTAFSRFTCISSEGIEKDTPLNNLIKRPNMVPDATILTGAAENRGIHLYADKTASVGDCPMSEMTLTPFGTNQVIAEWKDCQTGKLLLQKEPR
jgi:hypothetical protein